MGCQVFLFVSLPGVLRPYRVVLRRNCRIRGRTPCPFRPWRPRGRRGIAPLVIGQRAGAVDAVFLCIFHVFAHPCPVYVAVRIGVENRSLEFELDARPGTVDLHAGGIQVVFRLPVVVGLHVDLVEAEFAPVVMAAGVVERNPAERVVESVEVVAISGSRMSERVRW